MDDIVELVLAGQSVLIAKEYDISIAFLQVPNAFSIKIGSGNTALDLLKRFPPRTPFVLKINGIVQFMGTLDDVEKPQGEATELYLVGRDALAQLVDDDIEHDRSFTNSTFEELTRAAFASAGYDGIALTYDAAAHRRAVTGTPIVGEVEVPDPPVFLAEVKRLLALKEFRAGVNADIRAIERENAQIIKDLQSQTKLVKKITGYKTEKPIEWKAGTSHYQALNKELMRGGLFLRAGVDSEGEDPNVFLLSQPAPVQAPLFGLVRSFGATADNVVNVVPGKMGNRTTGRHARYIVRGRTGGGKDGRKTVEAEFVDDEMVALGFTKRRVVIDEHAKTTAQAQYLARKACADARRGARTLTYTVNGRHALPTLADPRRKALPTPDICVALVDDEHGMRGTFWVERVRFRATADGGTFTDLVLMVPDDLVFGDPDLFPAGLSSGRKVFGRPR